MKFHFKNNIFALYIIIVIFLTLFTYKDLPRTFYQQDEWVGLGHVMTEGFRANLSYYSLIQLISGSGRILGGTLNNFFYYFFPFQASPFFVFSLLMHIINAVLLFIIILKLTHNYFVVFIAGLFFVVASVGHQAVTWIAAVTTTLPSTLFTFLSLLFYLKFLEKNDKMYIYISLLVAVASFLFKDSSVFIFILLPILFFLYKKYSFQHFFKVHWAFFAFMVFAVATRIFYILTQVNPTGVIVTTSTDVWQKVLSHTLLYPLFSLPHFYISGDVIYPLSTYFLKINYSNIASSPLVGIVSETIIADMISLVMSFLLLVVIYLLYTFNRKYRKLIIFALLLTFLSFLPYVFLNKSTSYFESRYYYMGVAGAGILFAVFLENIRQLVVRFKISHKLSFITMMMIASLFYIKEVSLIQKDIGRQVMLAQERKAIISSLRKIYQKPPQKAVFYITGDHASDLKLPFQQGPGYTLMVIYYPTGVIPKELLMQNFLWGMLEQGYKETGGKGFGYFWDKEVLKKEVRRQKLRIDTIIGVFYKSQEKKVVDITSQVRQELKKNQGEI